MRIYLLRVKDSSKAKQLSRIKICSHRAAQYRLLLKCGIQVLESTGIFCGMWNYLKGGQSII